MFVVVELKQKAILVPMAQRLKKLPNILQYTEQRPPSPPPCQGKNELAQNVNSTKSEDPDFRSFRFPSPGGRKREMQKLCQCWSQLTIRKVHLRTLVAHMVKIPPAIWETWV